MRRAWQTVSSFECCVQCDKCFLMLAGGSCVCVMKHALVISCMHEGCDACLALERGYCCHLGYDGVGKAFEVVNADYHKRFRTGAHCTLFVSPPPPPGTKCRGGWGPES